MEFRSKNNGYMFYLANTWKVGTKCWGGKRVSIFITAMYSECLHNVNGHKKVAFCLGVVKWFKYRKVKGNAPSV